MRRPIATSGKVGNRGRRKKVRSRSVTNCERERAPNVAEIQKQFTEALQQQTATADILRAIASSPTDLQSVLDTLVESAARLCDASDAVLLLREDDFLRIAAHYGEIPVVDKWPVSRD